MRSSISSAVHVEPGRRALYRASHQAATKPTRYMIPYQCTRSGPMPKNGPMDIAMGLMLGYVSMRSTLNRRSLDRNRLSDSGSPESPGAPDDRAPDRPVP